MNFSKSIKGKYLLKKGEWLSFLFLLFSFFANAQETVVVGQVLNKYDRSPLESVNVSFKGTNVRTLTNSEGYFLIRNSGSESVLVFSLVGYRTEEVKVKPGESAGLEMLMEEKENLLDELLVRPGINPADDLMRKVRENRKRNNVLAPLKSKEQSLVLLSKNDSRWTNNRLFEQFKSGNVSSKDSLLLVPLYMEESEYSQSKNEKNLLSKNTFNSSETAQKAISSLLMGLNTELNFYNNAVSILGKSMISPLSSVGRSYYRYYLVDSIKNSAGKEYLLHFQSKNVKNLAFNGEMHIDSATLALTFIRAELPRQASLNFIHNLQISKSFQRLEKVWIPSNEKSAWNLTYELWKENNRSAELLIRRNTDYTFEGGKLQLQTDSFANSPYSQQQLEEKMAAMQQTSLYKTASYITNTLITGYLKAGIFDIGPFPAIARLTKTEGFRLGLPIRTSRQLWKNFMLGGNIAYGFSDEKIKFAGEAQWKLPLKSKRIILGASYLDDNRRIDYDYNNYSSLENPLSTADENMLTTLLSFKSQNRISKRKEMAAFLYNDWSPNAESKWIFRNITYYSNDLLPFIHHGNTISSFTDRNFSFPTRFSFGEKVKDEHFQRLYLQTFKPIIYATIDGGQYRLGDNEGMYGGIRGSVSQNGRFAVGEWRYLVEAGKIFGNVPYPLLKFFQGASGNLYNSFEFNLMNNREFLADTYGTLFSEVILNGVLFNYIPLVKKLNLREIAGFNLAYGTLNHSHADLMDIPQPSTKFTQPYAEASVGFCNLFGFLSVQSVWRLTNLNKPDVQKWGIRCNVRLTF